MHTLTRYKMQKLKKQLLVYVSRRGVAAGTLKLQKKLSQKVTDILNEILCEFTHVLLAS